MKVLSGFVSFCRYSLSRMSGMKYFPPREARRSIFFNLAAAVCTALLEAREYFLMNFSLMIFHPPGLWSFRSASGRAGNRKPASAAAHRPAAGCRSSAKRAPARADTPANSGAPPSGHRGACAPAWPAAAGRAGKTASESLK